MEPVTFFNSRPEISRREITLPSGKKIVLSRQTPHYRTEDKDEIEFLSKVSFVGARKLDDAEYRIWMTSEYSKLPNLEKRDISSEDIEAYVANGAYEDTIIKALRAKGYTVELKSKQFAKSVPSASTEFTAEKKPNSVPKKRSKPTPV